jgi:MazG family protein
MLRRHPHVFGSETERRAGAVAGSWERIKAAERRDSGGDRPSSALDGIAAALPALKKAQKLGKRAAAVGFDWPDDSGVRAKIDEELAELAAAKRSQQQEDIAAELGDVLFAVVNLARHLSVDAEEALAGANRRFEARFRRLETDILATNQSLAELDLEALETRWQAAKRALAERS